MHKNNKLPQLKYTRNQMCCQATTKKANINVLRKFNLDNHPKYSTRPILLIIRQKI